MVFTKKQLEEIRRGLAVLGVRDTDLPNATTLTGAELVAIVQGNENRKVAVGDLFGKYLEGMLPYAVRGMSAYEIAVANGYTGTVEQWLASLQAAIEIDNSFVGGVNKVASAEEAKWLKDSLAALQRVALTSDDVVNSLTSNAVDKPLSAAMGKELKRLINSGSGQSVNVVDNLNSNSGTDALSAKQGKVLKDLIDAMIELNNGIKKIYKWSEIDQIVRTGVIPEDIYKDSITAISDARVAYELLKLLRNLDARVKALEKGSGGGGGDDGGDSEGDSEDSGGDSEGDGGGSEGGDSGGGSGGGDSEGDSGEHDPEIMVSDKYLVADSDGLFRNSSGEYTISTVSVTVTRKYTDSDWDFEVTYGRPGPYDGFISASKGMGSSNKLNVTIATHNSSKQNVADYQLDGAIKVYLKNDRSVYDVITVYQMSESEESDFIIVNEAGRTSSRIPAMGGEIVLYVKSKSGSWAITDDDGLTISPMSGGNSSEEPITVKINQSSSSDEYKITATQFGTGAVAEYTILQDATISHFISLIGDNGISQTSVATNGGTRSIKVYASDAWSVSAGSSSWITPVDATNRPWSGNSGTGPEGVTIYFHASGTVQPRTGYLVGTLTGSGLSDYRSTHAVYQVGRENEAFASAYSAYFTLYGDYIPTGTSTVPVDGTNSHGLALVFRASRGVEDVLWCMPVSAIAECSDWLHINHYSPEIINGNSYYVHFAHTSEANIWYYIAADVDPLPENIDSRTAVIPIDIYTLNGHEYITTVTAYLTQEVSEISSSNAAITAEVDGETNQFAYNTRTVTINASCSVVYSDAEWVATIGDTTTDLRPTINGDASDSGDAPDDSIELVLQFSGDNEADEEKVTDVVIVCRNKYSKRVFKQATVSFSRLPEGASDESEYEPVIPDVPYGDVIDNYIYLYCDTLGASIYYKYGAMVYWAQYTDEIEITPEMDGLDFYAESDLNGVSSGAVSFTMHYTPDGSDGESEYDSGGESGGESEYDSEGESGGESEYDSEGYSGSDGSDGSDGSEEPPIQYYITLESDSLETSSAGASGFFAVHSNTGWSASTSYTGIDITEGDEVTVGDGTVGYDYDANTSTTTQLVRTIVVSADNSTLGIPDQVFTITQDPVFVAGFTFTDGNGNTVAGVGFEGGSLSETIYVTCDAAWHVDSAPAWVDVANGSGVANVTSAVTFTRNSTPYTQDGQIVFEATGGSTTSIYCAVDETPDTPE